ncbi:MAG: hypothetical protein KDD58_10015 [Bdellovibrionales bacterium]|nr:hypothetical protein [Bdellovibrionales bacterium]
MDMNLGNQKRKLTKFLCREMLYDYIQGHLDKARDEAVREYLENDEDLRDELENLKLAIQYSKELGHAELDESFLKEIVESKSYFAQMADQLAWRNLPEYVKWGLEAFTIAVSVSIFSIFVPWERVMDWIPREKEPAIVKEAPRPVLVVGQKNNQSETVKEPSEESNVEAKVDEVGTQQENQNVKEKEPLVVSSEKDFAENNNANVVTTVEKNELSQIQKLKEDQQEEEEELTEKNTKKKAKLIGTKKALKGELYRAFMTLDKIDLVTDEIREKIINFGGEKAGKVRLGWRKKDGSYFHFTFPEKNFEDLEQFLKSYGAIRVYKDPHWRVMPEGQIRIILWVEDSEHKK